MAQKTVGELTLADVGKPVKAGSHVGRLLGWDEVTWADPSVADTLRWGKLLWIEPLGAARMSNMADDEKVEVLG